MKKTILKAIIWLAVAWIGSLVILLGSGVTDLKQLDISSMMFGAFVGLMSSYIGAILPIRND